MTKLYEMPIPDGRLEERIRKRMKENILKYNFTPSNRIPLDINEEMPEDEQGYAQIEARQIEGKWYFVYSIVLDEYYKEITIPMQDIMDQRNLNLIDETSSPTEYYSYDVDDLPIAVETANGFETNIEMAMIKACEVENLAFMGVRDSCGADEVLQHYGIVGIKISTIFFVTQDEKQDIIHILYVGKRTTCVKAVEQKCLEIIDAYGFKHIKHRNWKL